ncbi:putative E3 ubiquitin-protein ligase UBR7 [Nelusetta ayraudi]|uniref:putative E3 ubiquitin-protein ligase UBR7 n=1 Tax=Nelusetta ayraudi TaxID=303726 RepID=UPI003F70F49E
MAVHKDDLDFDWVANKEELEEVLCVLAGSDPENCSYSRGYVKRQAVFACNTCTPKDRDPAGICLACANTCHDGHDIFELYTKRNFRCDCGNKRFGDFKCQLIPAKDQENNKNLYNHNFWGCYCTCDRPYPDTDDQVNDEMIQCVVCEDWFHGKHLGCSVEEPEELQEMVCEACMNKAPFLWTYAEHFAVPPQISVTKSEEERDNNVVQDMQEENDADHKSSRNKEPSIDEEQPKQEEGAKRTPAVKRTHDETMTGSRAEATSTLEACSLKELQARGLERLRQGAVFWPCSWRSKLCTCTSCKKSYVSAGVQFLMDPSDTVLAYEQSGLDEPLGQNPLVALTSSMDHVQQLEIIYRFKEITKSVTSFLDQCAADGKRVTVEGAQQFFEELRATKRCRTEPECE